MCCRGSMQRVADIGQDKGDGSAEKAAQNLSHFLGKVLDQLSITSWLPAAMLVGASAVLLQLRSQGDYNVAAAVRALSDKPLGVLVVLLFALVLAATVTQAFSFEAIRLLEGYWGAGLVTGRLLGWRVGRQRQRLLRVRKAVEAWREAAFASALDNMRRNGFSVNQVRVTEDEFRGVPQDLRPVYPAADVSAGLAVPWTTHCSPGKLAAYDRWLAQEEDFPDEHRLLPTRLGNVLRAREDGLRRDGKSLEGLVMRSYDRLPARLLTQHDQFRDRLEMYCTLVPVLIVLAVAGAAALARSTDRYAGGAVALILFGALAVVAYRAAIASARGYGVVLAEVADRLHEPPPTAQAPTMLRRLLRR